MELDNQDFESAQRRPEFGETVYTTRAAVLEPNPPPSTRGAENSKSIVSSEQIKSYTHHGQ